MTKIRPLGAQLETKIELITLRSKALGDGELGFGDTRAIVADVRADRQLVRAR